MARRRARAEAPTQAQARRVLQQHAESAVAVLVALMQDEGQKPELRMKAAESILDRACGKAGTKESAVGETPVEVRFEGVLEEWSR